VKYVDASAILRVLLKRRGPSVPLVAGEAVVSSQLVEVETYRAVDRERLIGNLDDAATARKRHELGELLSRVDLIAVSAEVIDEAKSSFAVNLRAIDAIHVATAVLITRESSEPLEFWTHDDRQATAALSRGLAVRGV
jgi:predicted nucleic acid-binding protein